jgi:hypothetical protein
MDPASGSKRRPAESPMDPTSSPKRRKHRNSIVRALREQIPGLFY